MSVDLKLVGWIKANRTKFNRSEIIEKLKQQGYSEQDIIDSYEEVVKRGTEGAEKRSEAVTVILSILIPGAGHIYTGAVGVGVLILILYILGVALNWTFFGMVIGIPLAGGMWLWGLLGSIARCRKINSGEL